LSVFATSLVAMSALATPPALVPPSIHARRCSPCDVHVDGIFDEAVWASAERSDRFLQLKPNELEPATQRTEVQIGYDDDNVYVAVYAHDDPSLPLIMPLARRDTEPPSDWIRIAFDSYADRRTAFEFGVNPAGVKVDAIISNDVERDLTWDAVWQVSTRIVSDGWVAEFRIPLSELRFSGVAGAAWGFQVTRIIQRNKETDLWAPTLQADLRPVPRYGALEGLGDLKPAHSVQLVPYARTDASRPAQPGALWSRDQGGLGLRAGGDAKARVTSALTLDATVFPDFGQVEADPSVVNLSSFEPYFKERRPFFVEGNEILRFGLGIGDGDLGRDTLYYSRRIGGLPSYTSLNYDSNKDTVTYSPTSTEIYGAAKLSGKTADGTSIALLDALASDARAKVDWGADSANLAAHSTDERLVPRTNFVVARAQQDFREGHSSVGFMATNVARGTSYGAAVTPAAHYATTAGLDFSHRSRDDAWVVQGTLAGSDLQGTSGAISNLQQSSARYYQRPDQSYLTLDPSATRLDGWAASLTGGKLGGEPWRIGLFGIARSPGFEANDVGYMQRADWALAVLWAGYRDYKPGTLFRSININTNEGYGTNWGGDTTDLFANINADVTFLNYWGMFAGVEWDPPSLDTALLRGGPAVRRPTVYSAWAGVYSDERQPVRGEIDFSAGASAVDSYAEVDPRIGLRPFASLNVELILTWLHRLRDRQYVTEEADRQEPGKTAYVIGRMKQDLVSLTARVDLAITPALTLQVYAQPFISGGSFSNYRKVVDGRAARYADRFASYYDYPRSGGSADFNFKQFRSTTVLRWEYLPGSALFLVWSQDRTNEDDAGAVRVGSNTRALFNTAGENVLLLKASYWLPI
jgi:hypothetical protein